MQEIVKLVNRTLKPIEFLYDAQLYILKGGEVRMLPRYIALHAVRSAPIRVDASSGMVAESMFGVSVFAPDGSAGKDLYPTAPLDVDPEEVKESDKLDAKIVPGDTRLKKKVVNLTPHSENFAANNNS